MSEIRKKYDEEFKKNAVKLSYASPKTVKEIADELGVRENLLYTWRKKYTKGEDGGTNPGGGSDTGNGTYTYVRFVNTAKYAVTVYADVSLLKELATVEANKSKTIAHEANTSGVAFYPKYHVDIESIKIPYPGTALVTRVDAGKTTEVTVADLTAFATSSAYIKVENASTDSLTLNENSTELTPEGTNSTILLQNEIGIYEVDPGSVSLYKLMKNTSTAVTLPAELEQFDKGYIYVLKYTNNRLELTKKLSIKQEIIPLAAPANVSASVLENAQIKITWTSVTGAGGYHIYRSTALSGTYTLSGTVNAEVVKYTDTGLTYNTEYYYKVASIYDSEEVAESVSAAVSVSLVFPSMVLVEGGSYSMGNSNGFSGEKPVHQVTVDSFYMSKYEVTQKEWVGVMGNNLSYFKGDTLPVEGVSWYEAIEYCNRLSVKEGLDVVYSDAGDTTRMNINANGYRLPTEAEWEYAARGGKHQEGFEYSGSNSIDRVAWYGSNSGSTTHSVGTKQANALGIYDLSGNVWEWCWDWYGAYSSGSQTNPTGSTGGSNRVHRGGGWDYSASFCLVSCRYYYSPGSRSFIVGFRPVRSVR